MAREREVITVYRRGDESGGLGRLGGKRRIDQGGLVIALGFFFDAS